MILTGCFTLVESDSVLVLLLLALLLELASYAIAIAYSLRLFVWSCKTTEELEFYVTGTSGLLFTMFI